ncbi:peptidyl-tRNA hydrolase [Haloactinopolyspora alba]|uniref:Peptidyl-tRNA hydrolase n=1 Tax=Haloactinopolyspora alba TaxID=648780 RepID=A0A2P8E5G9_9ACTN|nr:aminoacyl-tRNA hydrolase [Haloactinopolyspora alba]PSL04713.1 peptidyl-tRNA hydrolase [Haloactinopolyspora alba]
MSDATWIVVGLGNPGPSYAGTRHNVGAMVVELLAARCDAKLKAQRRNRADVAEVRIGAVPGSRAVLAVPRSYMNESGGPVARLAAFYSVPPERLLIAHDELDLPFGAVRLKRGGGDNGHNGLRSVRSAVGSGDYCRLRIGIGRPPGRTDPAAYVLKPFSAAERRDLDTEIDRAADAAEAVVVDGLTYAQNHYNG